MDPCNTPNFKFPKGFQNGLNAKFWIQPQTCYNGLMSFIHKKGQGALDHKGGKLVGETFMVGQILKTLVEEKGETCTMDGRRCSKPSNPN
jgi:hypothetical protein